MREAPLNVKPSLRAFLRPVPLDERGRRERGASPCTQTPASSARCFGRTPSLVSPTPTPFRVDSTYHTSFLAPDENRVAHRLAHTKNILPRTSS